MSHNNKSTENTSKGNKRALAALDKLISQRSNQRSNGSPAISSISPWMKTNHPSQNISNVTHLMDTEHNKSPTPKRRKITSKFRTRSASKETINYDIPILNPGDNDEDNYSYYSHSEPTLLIQDLSSPIHKSVAFSDKVELSPEILQPLFSSPKSSTVKPPTKSILRNPVVSIKTIGEVVLDTSNVVKSPYTRNIRTSPGSSVQLDHIQPSDVEYWATGEIHGLLDNFNIDEFRQIIEGGLDVLSKNSNEHCSKRFEIYATFNNIIPIITNNNNFFNTNNTVKKYILALNEKKIAVLVDNIEKLITVCEPHLQYEQRGLVNDSPTKDPFKTRLYVQIVRLFGTILSNFKIVKVLSKNNSLQTKIKDIYKGSIITLKNQHSNKAMIISQITFLKDEIFGKYYLTNTEIEDLIGAITQIREISSTNLISEKLLLIKHFQVKYGNSMLKHVSTWLPGEVIPRIILNDDTYSWKIVISAISILLDLLKLYIDKDMYHEKLFNCIEVQMVSEVVPDKFFDKLNVLFGKNKDIETLTLGNIIRTHIKRLLLIKKDYKIANDLWLAMVGLLYNNTKHLHELCDTKVQNNWIELNMVCFEVEEPTAKLLSLKVWRIIIYCVYIHVINDPSYINHDLLQLLQKPFKMSLPFESDPNIREGIMYLSNALTFVSIVLTSKTNRKANVFTILWEGLLKPIYSSIIESTTSVHVETRMLSLLFRIMGSQFIQNGTKPTITEEHIEWYNPHVIRVIASTGISLNDIPSIKENLYDDIFPFIREFCSHLIKSENIETSLIDILYTLIKITPTKYCDEIHFCIYSELIQTLMNRSTKTTASNGSNVFADLSSVLIKQFSSYFIQDNNENVLSNFLIDSEYISKDHKDIFVQLLKVLLRENKEDISELFLIEQFLRIDDNASKIYITNLVGSMLFPRTMSKIDFQSLCRIVSLIPTIQVIENFTSLIVNRKSENQNIFNMISFESWTDDVVIHFIKLYTKSNGNKVDTYTIQFLKEKLPKNEHIFEMFLPFLIKCSQNELISLIIHANPNLINLDAFLISANKNLYLPISRMDYFLTNLDSFTKNAQYTIIEWLLDQNDVSKVYDKKDSIINFFGSLNYCSDYAFVEDKLCSVILKLSSENKWWDMFEILIEMFINKNYYNPIEIFLKNSSYSICVNLKPKMLIFLASKIPNQETLFFKTINEYFKLENNDFKIEMIDEILEEQNINILKSCKKNLYLFFLDFGNKLDETARSTVFRIFQTFVELIMQQDNDLIYEFLYELASLLPYTKTTFHSKYVNCFVSHIHLQEQTIREMNRLKILYEALSRWQLSEDLSLYPDLFTSSDTDQIVSLKTSTLQNDVEVYATQLSDIKIKMSNGNQNTSDEIIENSLGNDILKSTIETRSDILSGVSSPSIIKSLNEDDNHLVRSTQLTPEKTERTPIQNRSQVKPSSFRRGLRNFNEVEDISEANSSQLSVTDNKNLIKSSPRILRSSKKKNINIVVNGNDGSSSAISRRSSRKLKSASKTKSDTESERGQNKTFNEIDIPIGSPVANKDTIAKLLVSNEEDNNYNTGESNQNKELHISGIKNIIEIKSHSNKESNFGTLKFVPNEVSNQISNAENQSLVTNVPNMDKVSTPDDFVNVIPPEEDYYLLKQMEKENSAKLKTIPLINQYKIQGSNENTLEEPDVKYDSSLLSINFPIFNSLKMLNKGKQDVHAAPDISETNNNKNESSALIKELKNQLLLDTHLLQSHKIKSQLIKGELSMAADADVPNKDTESSCESSPDLCEHFPTKKARRLVDRLHSFTEDDLDKLQAEERRNLRIEMLDFLLKLEYHTINDGY